MFKDFYLKIELTSENSKMPTRGTEESAGLDFYTPISFKILPWKDILIPLGIKTEFPKGYVIIFKEKSGIATKKKLDIGANCIDSDYRGEVHAHLFNNSDNEVAFNAGEKVVQGIVFPIWTGYPEKVESINSITSRGAGGFGSTGL